MVGWADNFRLVRIVSQSASDAAIGSEEMKRGQEAGAVTAVTVTEWFVDCLLCGGIFPLDSQHVMALGYTPAPAPVPSDSDSGSRGAVEMLVMDKAAGTVVSADTLPLHWRAALLGSEGLGPWEYTLLSTYKCRNGSAADATQWDLRTYSSVFGGDRGKAPIAFVVSPNDMLVE